MLELLKNLSMLDGVSGNEDNVRRFILEEIKEHCTDCRVDSLGNIIAHKKGLRAADKKVLIAAHMDEVGLIITGITEEGYLRFQAVGGIDPRTLFGTAVSINGTVSGVIAGKAVHHLSGAEKEKAPGIEALLIDIGAKSRSEAGALVNAGDFAAFQSRFYSFGNGLLKGKALDDRIGCALMIRLIQGEIPYDLDFCFNVQEEVGLRGAKVSAYSVKPDAALVLEATTAADLSGVEGSQRVCILGEGPVISFMDHRTVYDRALYQLAFNTAKADNLLCQPKTAVAGGNDAGAIHLAAGGIRTLAISLPCRYIHTPSCVVRLSDIEMTERFLVSFLEPLYDSLH